MEQILKRIKELEETPKFSNFKELKELRDEYARLLDEEQEAGLRGDEQLTGLIKDDVFIVKENV